MHEQRACCRHTGWSGERETEEEQAEQTHPGNPGAGEPSCSQSNLLL
jgi:hypothetical protein